MAEVATHTGTDARVGALERHLADPQPSPVVASAGLRLPPTTSPRRHRRAR